MTLTLNQSDWEELREQTPKPHPHDLLLDGSEELILP
jgi:hypothetical protein